MADLDGILARLERLEAENAALREELAALRPADEPVPPGVTRRQLLSRGGAAALGLGVVGASLAALAQPESALAAGDDGKIVHVGDDYTDVQSETALESTAEITVLRLTAGGNGAGLIASSPSGVGALGGSVGGVGVFGAGANPGSVGVYGNSPDIGVQGESGGEGTGIGVLGNSKTGRAVVGVAADPDAANIGVMGESFSAAGTGVRGWASGDATGVYGYSGDTFPDGVAAKTGVRGRADQDAASVGLRGESGPGRGAILSGGAAPLQLVPSPKASRPRSGAKGDLFVDAAGRLWFCRGGSKWKRLA